MTPTVAPALLLVLAFTGFPGPLLAAPAARSAAPERLRVEYLTDPSGIDTPQPRLSWIGVSTNRGARQTAYQILVASSPQSLAAGRGDLWDSGRVRSAESLNIVYRGRPLRSGQAVFWKVRVWDEQRRASEWSAPAGWSMGLLAPADWRGKWIGAAERPATNANPTYLLRRNLHLAKPLHRAMAYVCGLGYHEFYLNGAQVGDHRLDPGFTDYDRRVLYVTHDVTAQLQSGANVLGVMLGGGWYNQAVPDLFGFQKAPWRDQPKLLFQLELEFTDGTRETVVSDSSWSWAPGWATFADIRGGETHDARLARPDWSTAAGARAGDWRPVIELAAPRGQLRAQMHTPMRVTERVQPVAVTEPQPGVWLFDFGKNLTGAVQFTTTGREGQRLTLHFNEVLKPDGTLDLRHSASHTWGRFQRGEFILSGGTNDVFDPRFTYHGFRYVQVEGLETPPAPDSMEAFAVHNDLASAGRFESSHQRLNQLHSAVRRTILNSIHGMPAEEPTREKMGWTFDAQVLFDAYAYNFDAATAYRKFQADMRDAQDPGGHVPSIVPTCGWGRVKPDGRPGEYADPWWGSTLTHVAHYLHRHYGDTRILEESYPASRAYLDYLTSVAKNHQLDWRLGDWLDRTWNGTYPGLTPVVQSSTAAYWVQARLVSEHAALLGKKAEAKRYAQLADTIRDAFNREFLDRATGFYQTNSQTAQATPLYWGMTPRELEERVMVNLLADLARHSNHLTAGFVGALPVIYSLSDRGHADVAFDAVTKEAGVGWLYMVEDENSTLGENINPAGYGTRHHPYTAWIGGWFYRTLAGIQLHPRAPGFKQFVIKPACVRGLDWVRAHYDSPHGRIESAWERKGDALELRVTVPANTTATVYVPAGDPRHVREGGQPAAHAAGVKFLRAEAGRAVYQVAAGRYHFRVE